MCYDKRTIWRFFALGRVDTVKLLGFILIFLLATCGKDKEGGGGGNHQLKLEFTEVAEDTYEFLEFDDVFGNMPEQKEIEVAGGTFYQGTLSAHDGAKVRVYAVIVPNAPIDRILITVNGGTGTDSRFSLQNYGHKAMVMVSMRGLHLEHNIRDGECATGETMVECLKKVPWLKQVNPRDNGIDMVSVMRIIKGEVGSIVVDGQARDRSFFVAGDTTFNATTGSYGATILAYALAQPNLPTLGRIFLDGPSSPGEHVISDGFRNTNVALNNLLDTIGMNSSEKSGFLQVMKDRHTAPHEDCDISLTTASKDCLSSAMLFKYALREYETLIKETSPDFSTLKANLLAITSAEITSDLAPVNAIYGRLKTGDKFLTRWENANFDFTSGEAFGRQSGFTSRVGQICTAYISRKNGDSLSRFNAEKAKASNNPYWYGFLINYRVFLELCPRIAGNLTTGIEVPSGLGLTVEALVQHGAGIDEKHHQADIDEMASYIKNGVKESVYVNNQLQGGQGPGNSGCQAALIETTFDPTISVGNLAGELASVKTNDCGL